MLNKINFFQLDNLIRNRVPFILLNMGPSLVDLYTSVYKLHVETHEVLTDAEKTIGVLTERKAAKDAALLLICQDGVKSSELFIELQKNSYTNVYLIDGGYQQLMTERSQP